MSGEQWSDDLLRILTDRTDVDPAEAFAVWSDTRAGFAAGAVDLDTAVVRMLAALDPDAGEVR